MRLKLPRPSKRAVLIVLILVTFFIVLRQVPALEPVKMFIVSILAPVQGQIFKAGSKAADFLADTSKKRGLAKENRELRERISKLQSALTREYDKRLSIEAELKSLKVFLDGHEDEKIEGIRAHVTGRLTLSCLIANAGS